MLVLRKLAVSAKLGIHNHLSHHSTCTTCCVKLIQGLQDRGAITVMPTQGVVTGNNTAHSSSHPERHSICAATNLLTLPNCPQTCRPQRTSPLRACPHGPTHFALWICTCCAGPHLRTLLCGSSPTTLDPCNAVQVLRQALHRHTSRSRVSGDICRRSFSRRLSEASLPSLS